MFDLPSVNNEGNDDRLGVMIDSGVMMLHQAQLQVQVKVLCQPVQMKGIETVLPGINRLYHHQINGELFLS
jgi:hypothetical protein